jgi:integrase
MTTAAIRRRGRGLHPQGDPVQQLTGVKRRTLPEYLEAAEVRAILYAAPNPRAKLLILLQWRAGLRVSEALAVEPGDLSLDTDRPTLRVRSGKGGKSRIVPVHPELQTALIAVLNYADVGRGKIITASRSTAWRWVQTAVFRAEIIGGLPFGRRVGTHTFRHSYARHLVMHGIPINHLSRWLGHASITPTLVYLELVPDPAGSLVAVP